MVAIAVGSACVAYQLRPDGNDSFEKAVGEERLEPSVVVQQEVTNVKSVEVPAGRFKMGSILDGEASQPEHFVTLSQSFVITVTEITQQEYQSLMNENPSFNRDCPLCPVSAVELDGCPAFCECEINRRGT